MDIHFFEDENVNNTNMTTQTIQTTQNNNNIFKQSNLEDFEKQIKVLNPRLEYYKNTVKPTIRNVVKSFLGKNIIFYNHEEILKFNLKILNNSNGSDNNYLTSIKIFFSLTFEVMDFIGAIVGEDVVRQDEVFLKKSLVNSNLKNIEWYDPKIILKTGYLIISGNI